jgi:hypothetical protein
MIGLFLYHRSTTLKQYSINQTFFKDINLVSSYWAGFIAADGCIRANLHQVCIGLARKDKDHLIRFSQDCSYNGPIKDRTVYKNSDKYKFDKYLISTIHICGVKQWIEDLYNNFNISVRKSNILQYPHIIGDNKLAFIIGLIDGDGTIRINKVKRLEFSIVGTESIITWIQDTFNEMSPTKSKHLARARQRLDRESVNHWTYKLTGFRAYRILNMLKTVNVPKLARKWQYIDMSCKPIYRSKY